jgi:hypothetical protein
MFVVTTLAMPLAHLVMFFQKENEARGLVFVQPYFAQRAGR